MGGSYLCARAKADEFVFAGKRNDEENAKEKLYTYVSHVPVTSFKVCSYSITLLLYADIAGQGLETVVVE